METIKKIREDVHNVDNFNSKLWQLFAIDWFNWRGGKLLEQKNEI